MMLSLHRSRYSQLNDRSNVKVMDKNNMARKNPKAKVEGHGDRSYDACCQTSRRLSRSRENHWVTPRRSRKDCITMLPSTSSGRRPVQSKRGKKRKAVESSISRGRRKGQSMSGSKNPKIINKRNQRQSKSKRNMHGIVKETKLNVDGSNPKETVTEVDRTSEVVFKTNVPQERKTRNSKRKRTPNGRFLIETKDDVSAGPSKPKMLVTDAKLGSKPVVNAEVKNSKRITLRLGVSRMTREAGSKPKVLSTKAKENSELKYATEVAIERNNCLPKKGKKHRTGMKESKTGGYKLKMAEPKETDLVLGCGDPEGLSDATSTISDSDDRSVIYLSTRKRTTSEIIAYNLRKSFWENCKVSFSSTVTSNTSEEAENRTNIYHKTGRKGTSLTQIRPKNPLQCRKMKSVGVGINKQASESAFSMISINSDDSLNKGPKFGDLAPSQGCENLISSAKLDSKDLRNNTLDISLNTEEMLFLDDLLNMTDWEPGAEGAWPEDLNDVEVMPLGSSVELPNNFCSICPDSGEMGIQEGDNSRRKIWK